MTGDLGTPIRRLLQVLDIGSRYRIELSGVTALDILLNVFECLIECLVT